MENSAQIFWPNNNGITVDQYETLFDSRSVRHQPMRYVPRLRTDAA